MDFLLVCIPSGVVPELIYMNLSSNNGVEGNDVGGGGDAFHNDTANRSTKSLQSEIDLLRTVKHLLEQSINLGNLGVSI